MLFRRKCHAKNVWFKAGSHCYISISILRMCICTLSSKMADHNEEEGLLEIDFFFFFHDDETEKQGNYQHQEKEIYGFAKFIL